MAPLREYAFDVVLQAVMRVKATSESEARDLLWTAESVNDMDLLHPAIDLTEYSIFPEKDDHPHLFEVDRIPTEK